MSVHCNSYYFAFVLHYHAKSCTTFQKPLTCFPALLINSLHLVGILSGSLDCLCPL